MKSIAVTLFFLLAVVPAPAVLLKTKLSPVTRVVELMEGLSKQVQQDGKKEEDLYEKYVCWAKTVIDTKTASNAAAQSRIQELEAYISDLEAGRIELTSERKDLEKELADINNSIEEATAMREKEKEDFLEAQDEMQKAIAALEKAIEVLAVATRGREQGVLVQSHAHAVETFQAHAAEAATLSRAADLGERFLSKADAHFLRRILTGQMPERADWKTLNRKATFKMSYKARSTKIQEVLSNMLVTFQENLKEAQDKEAQAQADYDKLSESQQAQKEAAEEAYNKMATENGARGLSKSEAQDEVAALTTQVANDERFIKQVTDELATMKEEWGDRQTIRTNELEAISKAIAILRSDDARDLFKRSLSSQEGSFLQMTQHSTLSSHKASAAEALRKLAQESGDRRLNQLATTVATSGSHFDEVIRAIDEMVALLNSEEEEDLQNKQICEEDRMKDSRNAALASRKIDELSDSISRLQSEIMQLQKEIEANKEAIAKTQADLEEATRLRQDEHAEWILNNKDDEEAADLVMQATDVLQNFYSPVQQEDAAGPSLVQQPVVEAGKAPPPPPNTWDSPYSGRGDEGSGIIAALEMIHEDIVKDKAKAEQEENDAAADYQKLKTDSEVSITNLGNAINEAQGTVADKELEIKTAKEEQGTVKDQLDATMKKMAEAKPDCDYILVNYEMRLKNRQIEIDGLQKAKAILTGGSFQKKPDPNREMKPGDALFLQRRN